MPEENTIEAPPARFLAQMRGVTKRAELPDEVADVFAERPDMTVAKAEAVAGVIGQIVDSAKEVGVAPQAIIGEIVAAVPKGNTKPDPEKVKAIGLEAVSREWAGQVDDFKTVGAPTHNPMLANAPVGATVGRDWSQGRDLGAKMAAGLAARMGRLAGEDPGLGREFAETPLPVLALQWEAAHGRRHSSEHDAVRAVMAGSHSSSDFISSVVGASVELALSRGFEQYPAEIMTASREISRDDFKEWKMIRMGASSALAPIGEGGEFKHTTLDDEGEHGPQPSISGRIFSITEQALANDRVGALDQVTAAMLKGAVERVRGGLCGVVVGDGGFGQSMRDGNPVFDAAHGNIADTGAGITVASVGELVTKMRRQKGPGGESLDVRPRFLVVPPERETEARQFVADISAVEIEKANPYAGRLEVLVEPGLSDAGRWYVAGDPAVSDGLAHSIVGGGPRVESKLGWETATVEFRARLDIGFAFLDWRAWAMNPGA